MVGMTGLGKAIYEDLIAPAERSAEERGMEIGKEIGEAAATERIARTMLATGDSPQRVMEVTGLSEAEVSHLTGVQIRDRKRDMPADRTPTLEPSV